MKKTTANSEDFLDSVSGDASLTLARTVLLFCDNGRRFK